jgi:hypothetical protein
LHAHAAHQPLGKHRLDRGRQQERLHAHIDQPRDRAGRIVGVQRRQDEMARQ